MADIVVRYQEIIRKIGVELQKVWDDLSSISDPAITKSISFVKAIEIADEQDFVKKDKEVTKKEIKDGKVYIVVRFGRGAINYGSTVTPITLLVLGTANRIAPTQLLLSVFSSTWTIKNLCQGMKDSEQNSLESTDILQVWNTPEPVANFNEVYDGFRSLFEVSGNIVVGPSAIRVGTLTYYYGENFASSETINIMSFQDSFHSSLDSQPFGNTFGFVQSEVNFSTYTFSISTYLLNTMQLSKDVLAIRGFRYRPINSVSGKRQYDGTNTSKLNANDWVKVEIAFTNDYTNIPGDGETTDSDEVKGKPFFGLFKIVDSQIGQEIAGIPTLTIAFTR